MENNTLFVLENVKTNGNNFSIEVFRMHHCLRSMNLKMRRILKNQMTIQRRIQMMKGVSETWINQDKMEGLEEGEIGMEEITTTRNVASRRYQMAGEDESWKSAIVGKH